MLAEMLVGQVFPAVAYGMGDETECEIKSLLAVLPLTAEKKKIALSYLKRRSPGIRLLEEAVCEESVFDRMASLQISKLAIDLASRILDVDPAARLSAMDALKHPWFAAVRNEPREVGLLPSILHLPLQHKQTNTRNTYKSREKLRDRERQTERQIDRHTHTYTHTHTHTHRERERERERREREGLIGKEG